MKIRIRKSDIFLFLLIFPLLPIDALNRMTGDFLYDILVILDVILILYMVFRTKCRFSAMEIYSALYAVVLCAACVLNGRSIVPGLYYGGSFFAFVLVNNYYLKKGRIRMLEIIQSYLTVLILITAFFQYVNQGIFGYQAISGNYNNFLAGDNLLGYYYIPYIAISLILDKINHGKMTKRTVFMICICILSLIKAWSAKSIVGIAMVVVYILFVYGTKLAKLLSFEVLAGVFLAVFLGIVVFSIQENYADLIETVLHKDVSLTGRTYIWESSFELIENSPIYGYGTINGGMLKLSSSRAGNAVGTHNLVLEVLCQTGFVGLACFTGVLVSALKKKTKEMTESKKEEYYMILFMVFSVLIMFLTSHGIYTLMAYLPVVVCNNIDKISFAQGGNKI